jgi:hypothetical protein
MVKGILTREIILRQSFIHHFYTPDDGHRWDPVSLCTYAAQQSYHDTSYQSLAYMFFAISSIVHLPFSFM